MIDYEQFMIPIRGDIGEETRSRREASEDMRHVCHGNDVEPRQCIRNTYDYLDGA